MMAKQSDRSHGRSEILSRRSADTVLFALCKLYCPKVSPTFSDTADADFYVYMGEETDAEKNTDLIVRSHKHHRVILKDKFQIKFNVQSFLTLGMRVVIFTNHNFLLSAETQLRSQPPLHGTAV